MTEQDHAPELVDSQTATDKRTWDAPGADPAPPAPSDSDTQPDGAQPAEGRLAGARQKVAPAVATVRDKVGPAVTTARDRVGPAVATAREKVGPAVASARGAVGPAVTNAKDKVVPAVAPRVQAAKDRVADKAGEHPWVATAAERTAATSGKSVQVLGQEIRRHPRVAGGIGAALAAVMGAVLLRLRRRARP